MNYFYKLGQQTALEEVGLKLAQPANPGLAAQMQRPTWGLGGATPQGFKAPSAPAAAPTPPAAPSGPGGATSAVGNAPQPQKPVPAPSQPPGPSPAAAPGPESPFRQPTAPLTPSKKDLGISSQSPSFSTKETASSLGIPSGGKPF
jgi:hypothetical protein